MANDSLEAAAATLGSQGHRRGLRMVSAGVLDVWNRRPTVVCGWPGLVFGTVGALLAPYHSPIQAFRSPRSATLHS
jgi:hypothetical protein